MRRSARRIASSPSAITPTSIPANRRRPSGSRRSAPPTTSCRDKDKRARYDRGEIDAAGNEVPPQRPFYRDFGDAAGREKYRADAGFDPEDLESIFAQAFGGRGGTGGRTAVLDARPGRAVSAHARLPRCGQRHHAPGHAAGRAHAGRAHSGRRARRPGDPAEGPGHAGHRRRRAGRRAGRGRRRAASAVPPRGRRHHRRICR